MKFGVVFKKENKHAQDFALKAIDYLKTNKQEVLSKDNLAGADYIVTLGGDGTLIHAACEYIELNVPFVGINTGNLGFLTAVESDRWEEAIENLVSGKVFLSERITIEAQVAGSKEVFRAINEAAIKSYYRMSEMEILIDDVRFLNVLGDGVIFATQTGSTAYSLSAGGPIVDSSLDSLLVTPINPIGLPIPSVMLSPQKKILVKVIRGDDVSLIVDGQEHTKLSEGEEVRVTRGKYNVKLGYFSKNHFLHALNAKFGLAGRVGS